MNKLFAMLMIGGALFVSSCGSTEKTEETTVTETTVDSTVTTEVVTEEMPVDTTASMDTTNVEVAPAN